MESRPVLTECPLDDVRETGESGVEGSAEGRAAPLRGAHHGNVWLGDTARLALLHAGLPAAARSAGLSESSLRRGFRGHGTTVRAFVASERGRLILRLLSKGVLADRVARLVGLSGPTSLWRFTTREFGLAPSALRTARMNERAQAQLNEEEK